jgi:hypothetical protein
VANRHAHNLGGGGEDCGEKDPLNFSSFYLKLRGSI